MSSADAKTAKQRIIQMAKEHFKFDFEEWMAEELIHRDDWKDWYEAMCEILPLWEVNTAERVAMFIAQCGHESGGFRVLSENLNYSAKALNTIFPKYFNQPFFSGFVSLAANRLHVFSSCFAYLQVCFWVAH